MSALVTFPKEKAGATMHGTGQKTVETNAQRQSVTLSDTNQRVSLKLFIGIMMLPNTTHRTSATPSITINNRRNS